MSFGPHISRNQASGRRPGIAAHITVARQIAQREANFTVGAAAIFVGGPHERKIRITASESEELRALIAATNLRVIAHSIYTAPPWRGDPDAARYIREELKTCAGAGIEGLVVHLPKLPVAEVLRYLPRLIEETAPGVRVYLETPAVKPSESYYETPEKLGALFRAIRTIDPDLDHFGLCVDTAHLWVCGVDLQAYATAAEWLRRLDAAVPPSRVMFHLNDSIRARGIGPDTHARLGGGKMWAGIEPARTGLAAFVDYARRHGSVCILEREASEELIGDYRLLAQLAGPAPRAALPAALPAAAPAEAPLVSAPPLLTDAELAELLGGAEWRFEE